MSYTYKMPLHKCFPCLQFKNEEIITKLDYSNTALIDTFPEVWQHERTLEELYLTSTRINNLPPQLFYCQSLRVLMLNNNNLEIIPNAIGTLRQLQQINLSRNLIASVPENIKTCKNLTHLDLSCNNLQRLPDAITCLISLQELLLNETLLEFLPANFGRLVNLKILELRLNNLITLPKSMTRLSNLQRIDIGGNEFNELPEVIGELKQLRELWIDFNQIRSIPPYISKLRELQHLEANGNLIDTLPNEISNWRNIEVLSICTNSLQTFPFSIGMLKSLVTFRCESNELCELPDSIANFENLEELVLSHNRLMRLPATIGMLRKLRFLFVDDNELRGLPDELCSCSALSVLSISQNKITELPQNIGHLSELKVLNLVNNFISTLPVSILSLVNLTSLWISDNQSQPIVPLQYLDVNTKSQLTCFMLPQVAARMHQMQQQLHEFNANENIDEYPFEQPDQMPEAHEYVSHLLAQQQRQHPQSQNRLLYSTAMNDTIVSNNTSPHRRICFAEPATVLSDSNTNTEYVSNNNCVDNEGNLSASHNNRTATISYANAAAKSNTASTEEHEQLGARLMRSPTPYPKELRLMAKYVRNVGQKKISKKNPEVMHVKEARIMSNAITNTINNCDITNNLRVNDDYNLLPTQRQQNESEFLNAAVVYTAAGLTHHQQQLQQQQQQHEEECQISNNECTYNQRNFLCAIPSSQQYPTIHQQQQQYVQVQSYDNNIMQQNLQQQQQQQPVYSACYISPVVANSVYNTAPSPSSHHYEITNHHQQDIDLENYIGNDQMHPAFTLSLEPPPYHIARVFTKKTPEDLTNYDTLRYRQQQQQQQQHNQDQHDQLLNQQQQQCNLSDNSSTSFKILPEVEATAAEAKSHKEDIVDALQLNDGRRNMHEDFNFKRSSVSTDLQQHAAPNSEIYKTLNSTNDTLSQLSLCSSAGAGDQTYAVSDGKNVANGKLKTTWLFGVHKNPTVKQGTIKWENHIGFDIAELPQKEGIYVSTVLPNSNASRLLCVNDKLLEIDGYDFTNIKLADAKNIIRNVGSVVNIMLSRK